MTDDATRLVDRLLDRWSEWVIEDEWGRHEKRLGCSYEEIKTFYDAVTPHAPQVLDYLSQFDAAPDKQTRQWRAFLLMLSVAEIAQPVELYGEVLVPRGFDPLRLVPSDGVNARYAGARFGL